MKKIVLVSFIFLLVSCTKNEEINELTFIGKWKLIESFGSDGVTNPAWNSVSNGYVYEFSENLTFTRTQTQTNCREGYYTFENDVLTLTNSCSLNSNLIYSFKISYDGNNLILTPKFLDCIEGCGLKYEKIQ
ncbi:lipocalin family protein [Polaribacter gochangensis]|uniref:lipocalin family protein n=1 Tax=Polaribacter gochangensis TaxID=3252903 RepID=UPI00390498B6